MPVAGGWESWSWDETLFQGTAAYYLAGRLPYAEGIADAIASRVPLPTGSRLLDAGCGPGIVALQLAHLFAGVVGLDPDEGMLAAARVVALERGVTNARWVRMHAEDLPGDLGPFQVATFAASFHWMDRPRVAKLVREVLAPGGAVVQVHAPTYRSPGPHRARPREHPLPPDTAIDRLRRRYLGQDRRAGLGVRNSSPGGEDAIFQAAGFPLMERIAVPDGRVLTRTTDQLVAYVFSLSSTAPPLFGARIGAFEADLRALLARASSSGFFSVPLPDNELSIWRR
ncbi:MAG: class I SAM-dependent methyltransferase [Dehalococcoidia bacterium]